MAVQPYYVVLYKKVLILFLILGGLILLTTLAFYSPTADPFSFRSDLFVLSVMGTLFGSFVFVLGSTITLLLFVPKHVFIQMKKNRHPCSGSSDNEFLSIDDSDLDWPNYRNNDWYTDVTNPASPLYNATHSHFDD